MIPIRLKMHGIYSYQEEINIDFEELTSAGLFGIVGGVGSGKSAIVEAITFALYDRTDRIRGVPIAYNMMNLNSNSFLIDFEFQNHKGNIYKTTCSARRSGTHFEKIGTVKRDLYQLENEQWIPVESKKAEDIIGLNYDNFKRTIIIQQGTFREFIELTQGGRSAMLSDIFQLERFDLTPKTNRLINANEASLNTLQGRLQEYEEITEEQLKEQEQKLQDDKKLQVQKQKEYDTLHQNFQQLQRLKEQYDEKLTVEKEYNTLSNQKPEIEQLNQQIIQYDKYFRLFNEDINLLNETKSNLGREADTHSKLLDQIKKQSTTLTNKTNERDKIEPHYLNLRQKRDEEHDLANIIEIIKLNQHFAAQEERTQKGKAYVKEAEQKVKANRETIEAINKTLEELRGQVIPAELLYHVGQWFTQHDNLHSSLKTQQQMLKQEQENHSALLTQLADKGVNPDTFADDNIKQQTTLEQQREQLQKQSENLHVQQRLSAFTDELHSGKACPLCGSEHHPHILHAEDVSEELRNIEKQINAITAQIRAQNSLAQTAQALIAQLADRKRNIASYDAACQKAEIAIENHLKTFKWTQFDPKDKADFEQKHKATTATNQQIEKEQKKLQKVTTELEDNNTQLKNAEGLLQKIELEIEKTKTQITTTTQNLRVLTLADYAAKTETTVLLELDSHKQLNDKIEKEYQELTQQLNVIAKEAEANKALEQNSANRIVELNARKEQLENQLQTKLQEQNIENIETVIQVLKEEIDLDRQREKVKQFYNQYEIKANRLNELKRILEAAEYDNDKFAASKAAVDTAHSELSTLTTAVGILAQNVATTSKRLKEKNQMLQEHKKLQLRQTSLSELAKLFRNKSFLKYVSNYYLNQLCEQANVRFQRMTRNQLQLYADENNELHVIDHLNGGRSRNVKTLSGGQAFQASLSLALALAESVQTNAAADKNFFFIDEGFGTQDNQSVNIVFETLQSLNKENKIVGIISHVEELKERVPITLSVTKDDEHGSRVQLNR